MRSACAARISTAPRECTRAASMPLAACSTSHTPWAAPRVRCVRWLRTCLEDKLLHHTADTFTLLCSELMSVMLARIPAVLCGWTFPSSAASALSEPTAARAAFHLKRCRSRPATIASPTIRPTYAVARTPPPTAPTLISAPRPPVAARVAPTLQAFAARRCGVSSARSARQILTTPGTIHALSHRLLAARLLALASRPFACLTDATRPIPDS